MALCAPLQKQLCFKEWNDSVYIRKKFGKLFISLAPKTIEVRNKQGLVKVINKPLATVIVNIIL